MATEMEINPDDFPPLREKPAFEAILSCLKGMHVEPQVWEPSVSRAEAVRQQDATLGQHRREVATYLAGIIKSNLGWLDADQKETVWTEASRRLSERCGRAAMGEIVRKWPFSGDGYAPFSLTIREPPLTGDMLGHKTWGSSYVLAQMLPQFSRTSLSHLFAPDKPVFVLELGSGTGLLGLAAAVMWKADVLLTDLPDIIPNLSYNADSNMKTIEASGSTANSLPLVWGDPLVTHDPSLPSRCPPLYSNHFFHKKFQFQIILASDPLYDDSQPQRLADSIHLQLGLDANARFLVMVPERDDTTRRLLSEFREELVKPWIGLECCEEGRAPGQDDWDRDDEAIQVDFWWGIFKRKNPCTIEAFSELAAMSRAKTHC